MCPPVCLACSPTVAAPGPPLPLVRGQLVDFVHDGYMVVHPTIDGGDELHRQAWSKAAELYRTGEFGNNMAAWAPELDAVLDAPEVVGALTALLGEDYVLQARRHCHISQGEGAGNQLYHQDGFEWFRHAVPTDVMLFYYPQAVDESMGPTAVLPGSQYSRERPAGHERQITFARPGACVIMHFHLWHRATPRIQGGGARYMYKFQFRRSRPLLPAPWALWNAIGGENPFAPPGREQFDDHALACAATWAALCGAALPSSAASALRAARVADAAWTQLAVASGALPCKAALDVLTAATLAPPPGCAAPSAEAMRDAEGALQVCHAAGLGAEDGASAARLLSEARVGRELLGALPRLLPIDALLPRLLPLVGPSHGVLTQTRALMAIHDAAVACEAPSSEAWTCAARALPVDQTLLACVASWQVFLARAKGQPLHPDLAYGRYTLAEALRCVGRVCGVDTAQRAAELMGASENDMADIFASAGWRSRFARYAERRRVCPFTSSSSMF